jgi:hypothetical protein
MRAGQAAEVEDLGNVVQREILPIPLIRCRRRRAYPTCWSS